MAWYRLYSESDTPEGQMPAGALNVMDYGATADGETDDASAVQDAIDDCGTTGGTVWFPSGTYAIDTPVKLPAANTALLTITGYDATINLTNDMPRFVVWNRTSTGQTFQKFTIDNLTLDAQDNHPSTGTANRPSIVCGDMKVSSSYYFGAAINIADITVKDVTVLNVYTDGTNGYFNPVGIHICTSGSSGSYDIDNILIDNCRIEGGLRGINIVGYNSAATMTMDNIVIRDCWHDTEVAEYGWQQSTNYHVGSYAHLGSVEMDNCYGANAHDCCVEIDQPNYGYIHDCTMEESCYEGFYYTNFTTPLSGDGGDTYCLFENCTNNTLTARKGGHGFVFGDENEPLGEMEIVDCVHHVEDGTKDHDALVIVTAMDHMTVDGLTITHPVETSYPNASDYFRITVEPTVESYSGITINGTPYSP